MRKIQFEYIKFKNLSLFNIGIFIIGSLLSGLYAFTAQWDNDMGQLWDRAIAFLKDGSILPYGNAASSGIQFLTPGSFLSLSTAIPVWIWTSPYSPMVWIGVLHGFGLLFVINVLKKNQLHHWIPYYLVLYWCSPWRTSEVFLWNPTYMIFFTSVHFWTANQLKDESSLFWSILHSFTFLMALQTHSSFVVLIFISFFLFLSKKIKPHWVGVFIGLFLGFLTLIPYLVERIHHPLSLTSSFSEKSFLFRGIIYVYPFLKGVWYWFRQGSLLFPTHLLPNEILPTAVSHGVSYQWIWIGFLVYLVGIVSVLYSVYSNLKFIKELGFFSSLKFWKAKSNDYSKNWVNMYIACSMGAMLLASAVIPAEMTFWHLLLLSPISILVPIRQLSFRFNYENNRITYYFLMSFIILYMCFFTWISSYGSQKHSFENSYPLQNNVLIREFNTRLQDLNNK